MENTRHMCGSIIHDSMVSNFTNFLGANFFFFFANHWVMDNTRHMCGSIIHDSMVSNSFTNFFQYENVDFLNLKIGCYGSLHWQFTLNFNLFDLFASFLLNRNVNAAIFSLVGVMENTSLVLVKYFPLLPLVRSQHCYNVVFLPSKGQWNKIFMHAWQKMFLHERRSREWRNFLSATSAWNFFPIDPYWIGQVFQYSCNISKGLLVCD